MIHDPHQMDVHVNVLLPPGAGDMMLVSVTPKNAHVLVPLSGKDSTITWHLTGLPPTISGLEFTADGIVMGSGWNSSWGDPEKVNATTWKLTVSSADPPDDEEAFKYTLQVQWTGGSAQIDPEIEFDPES